MRHQEARRRRHHGLEERPEGKRRHHYQQPGDGDVALARCRQDDPVDQLVQIGVVYEFLVAGLGNRDGYPFAREDFLIEAALHREAGAEKTDALQLTLRCRPARGLDDADERDGRGALDLVEHDVRRVGGQQPVRRAGPREAADFLEQVRGQASKVARADELQDFCQVDAVDDDRGITPVWLALSIGRDEKPVVIDRGFRTDAADDANQFHAGPAADALYGSCESIRMNATRQGLPLRFTHAWLVACCTTTSPALRCTSPSSSSMSISPDRMIA